MYNTNLGNSGALWHVGKGLNV